MSARSAAPSNDSVPERSRATDSDQTVAKIVAVAAALFAQRGFVGTSTQEIADAAGVVKATLFYHIGTKEELLGRVIHELLDTGTTRWRSVIDRHRDATAPETIRAMVREHCLIMSEHKDAVAVFGDELRHLTPGRREQLTREWDVYRGLLEQVIVRGVRHGELRDTDTRVLTLAVLTMLSNNYRWYSPGGRLSAIEIGDVISEILLAGLLVGPRSRN